MQDDNNINNMILQDVNRKNNKKVKWKEKKEATIALAESYLRLKNYKKAMLVKDCGTDLEFVMQPDNSLKLHSANFCKVRLCPMCAWRRSLKIFGQVSKIMCELEKDKSYSYIFLTLTIRNCLADALSNNIDVLNNGFKQLTRKKQYKSVIQGHFKALEITHNKTDNSYHPHLHCILVVTQSYFKPQNYIKKDDWIVLWQKSVKADYKPSIDVQKIHQTTSKRITSAVAEVTKYTVKQTEYISDNNTYTDYLVSVYDGVLAHRRLVSFGGVMKDLHKKLNLSDVEQDLVHTDNTDEPLRSDVVDVIVRYRWGIGASGYNYYLVCDDM